MGTKGATTVTLTVHTAGVWEPKKKGSVKMAVYKVVPRLAATNEKVMVDVLETVVGATGTNAVVPTGNAENDI